MVIPKIKKNQIQYRTIIIGLLIGAIGYISGYTVSENESFHEEISSIRQTGYSFINPLLECETSTKKQNQKYIPFEQETINRIQYEVQDVDPDIHLSVYFRNLNNGPWFGINEKEDFSPASLMKLPILIMYLKWSEEDPSILKKTVKLEKNPNSLPQMIQPIQQGEIGKEYSIEELLSMLIVYSDNSVLGALLSQIPEAIYNKVFTDLGVPLPKNKDYTLSVKDYASFFRILYNASYLSNENSEKALSLLAQTTFNDGIRGNIPNSIQIAHKFGERELKENSNNIYQLHDCGIIYYTAYPYLACIMTKGGTDMNKLSGIIQKTSNIIFEEVSEKFH